MERRCSRISTWTHKQDGPGAGKDRNIRDTFVRNSAVIDVIDSAFELLENEIHACASRQQKVLTVLDAALFCPFCGTRPAVTRQVRALWEEQQPHGIEVLVAIGSSMAHLELAEAVG